MTRNHITNDEVEAKSWVVIRVGHNLELHQSRWAPGYTPAYTKTPLQAITYALDQHKAEDQRRMDDRAVLNRLYEEYR